MMIKDHFTCEKRLSLRFSLLGRALYPGSSSMKPLDGMLVHCRVTPALFKLASTSTHLYTWVERGTMRVKCLA